MKKVILTGLMMCFSFLGVAVAQDIIDVAPGAGTLEQAINNDVDESGYRLNKDRIYRLQNGGVYLMYSRINYNETSGTLTIMCPPGKKAAIIPTVDAQGSFPNRIADVTGSLTLKNLYVVGQVTNGERFWSMFNIHTANQRVQTEDCVFELGRGEGIDMQDVPSGARIIMKNCYWRDVDNIDEWWSLRILNAKVPTDSVWLENVTVSNAGLGLILQGNVHKFFYMNHCSFINSDKYPILGHYFEEQYVTNNLFVNCNNAGEDYNIYGGKGQDPDGLLHGIITVDTLNASLYPSGQEPMALDDMKVFVSDNIHYVSPLFDPYYSGEYNKVTGYDSPISELGWMEPGVFPVENVPPIWMNERSAALVDKYPNMIVRNNHDKDLDPQTVTPGIADAEVARQLAYWNNIQYNVAGEETFEGRNWLFGDGNPLTLPGPETEDGDGITHIADFIEDFTPQNPAAVSSIDGRPIGALHWIPAQLATWDSKAGLQGVLDAYENDDAQPGLVAYYKFDETTGKKVKDSSGNGNDGTLQSGTWTTGRLGGGLALNGTTDYVSVPDNNSLDLPDAITVSAWVFVTDTTGSRNLLQKGTNYALFQLRDDNVNPSNVFNDGSWHRFMYDHPRSYFLETWSFVAMTYDGTTVTNYVDGQISSQFEMPGSVMAVNGDDLGIGQNSPWGDARFAGIVDEVRIYNYAMTVEQLDELLVTGVEDKVVAAPVDFDLKQNYPNPFNPTTTITYSLGKTSQVELTIFNLMGNRVKTLVNGRQAEGMHSLQWDGSDEFGRQVTSGIYCYRLKTESKVMTKKMLLVR